jgi:hypothetical protein
VLTAAPLMATPAAVERAVAAAVAERAVAAKPCVLEAALLG